MPTLIGPLDEAQEITMAATGAHQLTYATQSGEETPGGIMQIYVDGTEVANVTLKTKYLGKSFTFTLENGASFEGTFADGPVNFSSPVVTTTASPSTPTTPAPSQGGYTPNTDGYSSTVNVYHLTGTANDNNGGVVKRGGNLSNTEMFASTPIVYSNERQVVGSVVVDGSSADKAVSAGVFAKNTQTPIAKRVTIQLGGVVNTVLRSGAAQPALVRSINKTEVVRTRRLTTAMRSNKYNRYTGQFDAGYPVVAVDPMSTDNAATPSRSNPGQIVFKTGAKLPVATDYKPKTN